MDSIAPDRLYFDTDALPERDRFPIFCEEVVRAYTGLDLRTKDQSLFHASLELRRVGAIDIGRVGTSQIETARTSSHVHDGDDSLLITLVECGQAIQTQCDDDRALGSGDAIICDCGYPGELNFVTESRFWDLKIPREKLTRLFPRATHFAGAKLDRNPAARRLLFSYLSAATDIDLGVGSAVTSLCEEHIVDLVALALGVGDESHRLAEQRGARTARRSAVLREIDRRSADPALSAARIAALLEITPRYVHLLLEETGKSFTHHVLDRRLERAVVLLRDRQWGRRKIADIAAAAGFTDLSYFNRVFRRRYGATPSDMREAAHPHG